MSRPCEAFSWSFQAELLPPQATEHISFMAFMTSCSTYFIYIFPLEDFELPEERKHVLFNSASLFLAQWYVETINKYLQLNG